MSQKVKISGFTLIRNGQQFDYPYLESIRSLLPLVDELIINVGYGTDNTLEQVEKLAAENKKIKLFQSDWQLDIPEKLKSGLILSEQTNLALDHCTHDWCIYLQADEVLHEKDYELIQIAIQRANSRPEVEGLLFDYIHFYGSFNVIQKTRSAYRREVRVIRKSSQLKSIADAQSFRKLNREKPRVIHSGARIFHYGWVRTPEAMKQKTFFMDQLYHGKPSIEQQRTGTPHTGNNYRYKKIWGLRHYTGDHPEVMKSRISQKGWHWDLEKSPFIFSFKDIKRVILDLFEKATGIRLFEYRCYRLMK